MPTLVCGPEIATDLDCETPVVAYDLLPTILDLVAPRIALPPGTEGGSWKPLLVSGCGEPSRWPGERLVFLSEDAKGREPGPQAAIIDGKLEGAPPLGESRWSKQVGPPHLT